MSDDLLDTPSTPPQELHNTTSSSSFSSMEEDAISKYTRKRNERIQAREAEADRVHQETIQKANSEIEAFYKRRAEEKERKLLQNQQEEKAKRADREKQSDNVWARAADYVDFKAANSSGRDTSRLRKLMIDLKNTK